MQEYHDYGPRLSTLEGQMSGMTVQMTGMMNNQAELAHKMDRIIEKMGDKPGVNWGWLVSGLIILGMVIALYTQPIQVTNVRQTQLIDNMYAMEFEHSAEIARLDERSMWMMQQLEDVDKGGSRKWVGGKNE